MVRCYPLVCQSFNSVSFFPLILCVSVRGRYGCGKDVFPSQSFDATPKKLNPTQGRRRYRTLTPSPARCCPCCVACVDFPSLLFRVPVRGTAGRAGRSQRRAGSRAPRCAGPRAARCATSTPPTEHTEEAQHARSRRRVRDSTRDVVGRGRGETASPHFFDRGTRPLLPALLWTEIRGKLVHCCNWLLTETQCKIISVQQKLIFYVTVNLCLSLVSAVPTSF